MDNNIIEEVKKALCINTDESDVRLCQLLKLKIKQTHPDNQNNNDSGCESENECKKLTELYTRLKKYIEEKTMSTALSVPKESEMVLFQYMNDIDVKEETIKTLMQEKLELQEKVKSLESQLKEAKDDLSNLLDNRAQESKKDLSKIYRPRKYYNVIGIAAFIAMLSTSVPQLKKIMADWGLSSTTFFIVSIILVFVWGILWLRKYIVNGITDSIIYEVLNDSDLEEKLEVKSSFGYPVCQYRFSRDSLSSYIRKLLNKGFRRLLTAFGREKLINTLTDHIVFEFYGKGIIKDQYTKKFTEFFVIEEDHNR